MSLREFVTAVENDDEKLAKKWLKRGVDVNGQLPGGWSAMHGATRNGHKAMLKFLLKNGGDLEIKTNSKQETPLHIGAFQGKLECVKFLVRNGAELYATTKQKKTPLDLAEQRQHSKVVKYLRHKAESDAKAAKKKGKKRRKGGKDAIGLPVVPALMLLLFLLVIVNMLS